eukprot:UN19001
MIIERFSEYDISITSRGLSQARILIFSIQIYSFCLAFWLIHPGYHKEAYFKGKKCDDD